MSARSYVPLERRRAERLVAGHIDPVFRVMMHANEAVQRFAAVTARPDFSVPSLEFFN